MWRAAQALEYHPPKHPTARLGCIQHAAVPSHRHSAAGRPLDVGPAAMALQRFGAATLLNDRHCSTKHADALLQRRRPIISSFFSLLLLPEVNWKVGQKPCKPKKYFPHSLALLFGSKVANPVSKPSQKQFTREALMMELLAVAESDESRTMGHSVGWRMPMKRSYFLCGAFPL
ncbi:hypothetical protein GGX14DRAFT_390868 [Mycena pura]|uniref:Uncharacterized protein n=1 Tax=Mycena pura TaxID=153505 RepID=A0AAD6VLZ8_9AGAR|nr:hypothetical protein GGX14DRAFT_390868 [Mycena pura]